MKASPTLRRVAAGELCAGCGLCAGVSGGAIELETVEPGYTRPRQVAPLSAEIEAKVAGSCPGAIVAPWPTSGDCDMYWGPYREVLTGSATDPEVRHRGSSGGALSAIAIHALDCGLVDAVLHVTADPARPTRNILKVSRTRDEVLDGAGSRYAASSPLAGIGDLLASGLRYAVIGKPCDISALRQLARFDARVDLQIPLMLSFFCGGMPSHAGADRIVRSMGLPSDRLTLFRYRGFGWPGKTVAETEDGRRGEMNYADSWGGHLSKEVQFRCKICPDAVGGVADVAAADAWYGGETGYPQFDEQDGRSLIIARSDTGSQVVRACTEAGSLAVESLALREIDLMQPSQANRKRLVLARRAASATLLQPLPIDRGLMVKAAARKAPWRALLRNYFGTARRIVMGLR